MNIKISYHLKIILAATIISTSIASTGLRAEDKVSASKAFTEGTKQFLSDPARTGSLVGSILAGAALANPLAPILGSVAGFIIGKSSAYSKNNANSDRRLSYTNRDLSIQGSEAATLTGLTGNQPQTFKPTLKLDVPMEKETDNHSNQNNPVAAVPLQRDSVNVNQTEHGTPLAAAAMPLDKESEIQSELNKPIIIVESSEDADTARRSNLNEPLVFMELPRPKETESTSESTNPLAGNSPPGQKETEQYLNRSEPLIGMALPIEAKISNFPEQHEPIVVAALPEEKVTKSLLQQKLANSCNNVNSTQTISLHCYYYSQ